MYHLIACYGRKEFAPNHSRPLLANRWTRIALWLALLVSTPLYADPIAIAHAGEGRSQIERKTLRAAFSMTLQMWPDGHPVTVFVLRDDNPLHQQFCRKVLGVLPYTLRRNWDRLLFSGAAQAPITVDNSQEMLRRVASTPGAIGYIEKELSNDSISIIEVVE
ncbi:MAG: hypothetical protein QM709_00645 [Spongiibacteraceae bacterium]